MTGDELPDAGAGARCNAAWCDLVTRVHGGSGVFTSQAWTSPLRTPPLYPDAVTLKAGTGAGAVLSRIDAGAGSSVKDSFCDLDLAPHGYEVLFTATWIAGAPRQLSVSPGWRRVDRPAELADWEAAWGGTGPRTFPAALLDEPDVMVLWNGQAGGIAHRSGAVLSVSNVFTAAGDPDRTWHDLLAMIAGTGLPVTGYEHGDDLAAAIAAGMRTVGELRVWLR